MKTMRKATRELIDGQCENMLHTISEINAIVGGTKARQAMNGIAGLDNLKAMTALAYADAFEKRLVDVHKGLLDVIESCSIFENLEPIPEYIDSKLMAHVQILRNRIEELVPKSRISRITHNGLDLYLKHKREFDVRANVLIRKKQNDFKLKVVLPIALGVVGGMFTIIGMF